MRNLLIIMVLLATVAGVAVAQEATILGTVTDPSGAAVPNVSVIITNTDTSVARRMITNSVGQYVAPDLHIGHYMVRAEASGFKATEAKDIVLTVGLTQRVDLQLELGSTRESVSVESEAVRVQTDSGEVSEVINGQQMTQLATNGRSVYSLTNLIPGATSAIKDFEDVTPVGADTSVSFNGGRSEHNLYMIDGGEADDRGGASRTIVVPSIDAIAEFRVLSSNYSADYGLTSAATITMAIKSGAKTFHATLWEFVRNDDLDANYYFYNMVGKTPPELRFNTYGFNAGGPVYIPGLPYNKNKDKTFFFYNMEWRKLVEGGVVNQVVPYPSTYSGVFPASIPITNPTTGAPFPNNTIPTSMLDPNAQVLLKTGLFPTPNSGQSFIGGNKQPTNVRDEVARVDHMFSEKFWIFGHFIAEQIDQTYGTGLWGGNNLPTASADFNNPSYHGVLHATWMISPTLLDEMAFNYNGNRITIAPTGLIARPSDLDIPRVFSNTNNLDRLPGIALQGATGADFDLQSWPWHNTADDYQIRDDVAWTKGSHQFKFGGSWAIYKKVQDLFGDTQGSFGFNGHFTGNDFADFLLGDASSYSELALQSAGNWNNVSWATWVQDNWRVNSRLTLNLGLRWDGVPHTYEVNGHTSNFYPSLYNPADAAILLANGTISPNSPGLGTSPVAALSGVKFYLNGIGIPGQNGISNTLVGSTWDAFGPRIGIAYDLTGKGKTVIRAGFGIMYERMQGNDMYNAGPNVPFSAQVNFNNVSLSNPDKSLITGQAITAPITVASIEGMNTPYKLPTSNQFSVGIQHELFKNSVLTASYVGNQNRHQMIYNDLNLPSPSELPALIKGTVAYNTVVPYAGFNYIRLFCPCENSHYNALQTSFKSQARKDLTIQVAYTYSHTVDMNNNFGGDLTNVSNPYNFKYDYGTAYSDVANVGLVNFIYDLPFFRDTTNRFAKTALGGWELSGIVTMMSGFPLNITLGGAQGSNGLATGTNRPDYSGTVTYPSTRLEWFSTSSFSLPALGDWGNLGHGVIRGPGRDNWNVSLFKSFLLSEKRNSRLEFRAESFNTFNHTQFQGNVNSGGVSSSFTASNFGQVTSTWDPRVFQLGMKLIF